MLSKETKDVIKASCTVVFIVAVVASFAIFAFAPAGFISSSIDLAHYKFFAPKYADAQRDTFKHSNAYIEGMVQEIQNMQFQYEQADPAHRDALAGIILHRVANFPEKELPADTRLFINGLRRGGK